MIKLVDLIKETEDSGYKPYMYSPIGFSCHVCKYHYKEDGIHKCSNSNYKNYKGTAELIDEEGNPIKDPTKWCSNWFEPINVDSNK